MSNETITQPTDMSVLPDGVEHGPWPPLNESELRSFERYQGDEYDWTDIGLQSLRQHYHHWRAIGKARQAGRITEDQADALWANSQAAAARIESAHLTR